MMTLSNGFLAQTSYWNSLQAVLNLGGFGSITSLLVVLTSTLLLVGAARLVWKGAPQSSIACYAFLLPIPIGIAMMGSLFGGIRSLSVVANEAVVQVTSQEIALGLAAAMASILLAFVASIPAYMVLAYGLFSREFLSAKHSTRIGSQPSLQSVPNAQRIN